ncbi:hypothetical protein CHINAEXTREME_18955 [Halobiforma lacisalsi AJ5]|uniref:Uncharacterized protein n=1 Tax=Natronobacterium lacisalsi AJ5 TaxID=358396 RepID=M0LR88_NATLA|nr:hypothetical protein [Halobiforma lacisalsi]APW99721.1 hypothetical protein CHINAEXTREME_18955 [Halobiforma lacisalsi AJ5]EMA36107.1 hypothetical protein C445_04598 [Halobiforma lacisalsi AJ5]
MVDGESLLRSARNQFGTSERRIDRSGENRIKEWVLFDGNRERVATGLLAAVFVLLLVMGGLWPIEYQELLSETTMVQTMFDTLLSGTILLVSIVVSIAAVGISQELTSLGDQSERVDTTIDFQAEIEDHGIVDVSPARPGKFTAVVLRSIKQRAHELQELDGNAGAEYRHEVDRLQGDIRKNTEEVLTTLSRVPNGSTDELLTGLNYDSSWQLHQSRRILTKYDDRLTAEERAVIEDIMDTLHKLMVCREYFKTLYYKLELSDLTTTLLTVSLPIIVFITYVLLALDSGLFPDVSLFGYTPLTVFISFAYTIALAPYAVLTSYVLRAATVTKLTPEEGPFVLDADRETAYDREE